MLFKGTSVLAVRPLLQKIVRINSAPLLPNMRHPVLRCGDAKSLEVFVVFEFYVCHDFGVGHGRLLVLVKRQVETLGMDFGLGFAIVYYFPVSLGSLGDRRLFEETHVFGLRIELATETNEALLRNPNADEVFKKLVQLK